ncbi:hypothetical protein ABZ621_01890 [Streptomyces sp. NPDC007863]
MLALFADTTLDALRARITAHDPLPFANEESPWHLALEEVAGGIW